VRRPQREQKVAVRAGVPLRDMQTKKRGLVITDNCAGNRSGILSSWPLLACVFDVNSVLGI
jgi:hypothetical protein